MASKGLILAGAALAATMATPAMAQGSIEDCRSIADSAKRLACYDALSGQSRQAQPVPESDEARVERQTQQFGLTEQQKAPEDRKEVERVTAAITGISGSRITLDNGMVWRVTDGSKLLDWAREGQVATVKQGFLSGYRMTVEGVRGLAVVERIR